VEITKKESTMLLIDSGAQLSFLKYSSISDKKKIDENFSMKFRGIIGCIKSHTLGTIESGIYINNVLCPHEFHIVNDYVGMGTTEGILGSDFMSKYECILNYGLNEIQILNPKFVQKKTNEAFEKIKENWKMKENDKKIDLFYENIFPQPYLDAFSDEESIENLFNKSFIRGNRPKEERHKFIIKDRQNKAL
jgi:hypothetical protein